MRVRTIAFCFCAFAIALAASPAWAAGCSNASLKGVFGYVHGRPGVIPSGVTAGQLTFDGLGNVTSGSWTETQSGTITSGTTTGKYSVLSSCTGTLTLTGEDASTDHYYIDLNSGNQMFQMIENDSDSNQPGFGLAEGTVTCGLTGKKQVLTTNLVGLTNGTVADTVGQVTLDGNGNISGTEAFTLAGVVSKLAVTGTYTENTNCTGTWKITPTGGSAINFNTVVVSGGKELILIETDNNTVTSGNAQQ